MYYCIRIYLTCLTTNDYCVCQNHVQVKLHYDCCLFWSFHLLIIWSHSCSCLFLALRVWIYDWKFLMPFFVLYWNNSAFERVWFCKLVYLQPGSSTQLVKLIYREWCHCSSCSVYWLENWIICQCWIYKSL